MGINLKIDNHLFKAKIATLSDIKSQVEPLAYQYFVAHTPIRKGYARAHTTLHNDIIDADYAYAEKLDTGYSQQAPDGMSKPTEAYLNTLIKNYIRRIGAK